ncbi:f-box protein pp2-a12 [Quercus suber]|uniref:F-box protein pp2-a12 n=1 Tax=Quercus suber TaxID=58331 RepID=A0AAW0J3Q3_QUESU
MGADFSALFFGQGGSNACSNGSNLALQSKPNLGDLPEDCVALILGYFDPPEICKLARMNRAFRGASWADFVWKSKLPSNYERVWLHKRTGGVCLSIASKGLAITGIDDRRYWNHIPTEESRFCTVAYLQQIWWFEVDGEVDFPLPTGSYSVFFKLQLGRASKRFGRRICNSEHVHGWDIKPVQFQLWTSDGQHAASKCFLKETGKWNYYHVGTFVVDSSNASTKIKFSMTQIDCTHTKGGLCLDSVVIYPNEFRERLTHF